MEARGLDSIFKVGCAITQLLASNLNTSSNTNNNLIRSYWSGYKLSTQNLSEENLAVLRTWANSFTNSCYVLLYWDDGTVSQVWKLHFESAPRKVYDLEAIPLRVGTYLRTIFSLRFLFLKPERTVVKIEVRPLFDIRAVAGLTETIPFGKIQYPTGDFSVQVFHRSLFGNQQKSLPFEFPSEKNPYEGDDGLQAFQGVINELNLWKAEAGLLENSAGESLRHLLQRKELGLDSPTR